MKFLPKCILGILGLLAVGLDQRAAAAPSVCYGLTPLPGLSVDDDGASINNRGQVASGGVRWYRGHRRTLSVPLPHSPPESAQAHGINEAGTVVGEASGSADGAWLVNYGQAIVWHSAKGQGLPVRVSMSTVANAINNAGVVVGTAYEPMPDQDQSIYEAFLLRHGRTVFLRARKAIGINNRGQILVQSGFSRMSLSSYVPAHFLLLSHGKRVQIKDARTGAGLDDAVAMNDAGVVVGSIGNTACLWRQGHVTKLGRLSGEQVDPAAINNREQIVGKAEIEPLKPLEQYDSPETHAFLWQHGRMTDLNHLLARKSGWVLYEADAINDRGQIVCWGSKGACLLTPMPITAKRR